MKLLDEPIGARPAPDDREVDVRSARASIVVFAGAAVVAWCALVFDLGRYHWFHGDEWQFLAGRDGGSLSDLIEPHNEHPQVIPVLAWRTMFNLWGLSSYVPYQIPVITLHVALAVLLWIVIRRCGVNQWIATAAGSVFLFFGPGEENIVWAFQLGFAAAVVFGLAHLLLADHQGPLGGRDLGGLLLGFLGLLSAGFAPVLTAIVFAVVWVRRGLVPALFHSVPLAVVFVTWWLLVGPDVIEDPYGRATDIGEVVGFVRTGYVATFDALAPTSWLAVVYAAVLVVGLVVAYAGRRWREALYDAVLPVSLLVGGLVFITVSGVGRWWIGPDAGEQSRYLYLVAAFTLPAFAVAVDALVRRWTAVLAIACVALVAVIPQNIDAFGTQTFGEGWFDTREAMLVTIATSPLAEQVPPETRPDPLWTPVPVGWLLDLRDRGELPDVDPVRHPIEPLLFGLAQYDEPRPEQGCAIIREAVDLELTRGQELGVGIGPWTTAKDGWFTNQSFTVQLLDDGEPVGAAQLRHPSNGEVMRVQVDQLEVRIDLFADTESLLLCTP